MADLTKLSCNSELCGQINSGSSSLNDSKLLQHVDGGAFSDFVYLDFHITFHSISPPKLFLKLKHQDIHSSLQRWFYDSSHVTYKLSELGLLTVMLNVSMVCRKVHSSYLHKDLSNCLPSSRTLLKELWTVLNIDPTSCVFG